MKERIYRSKSCGREKMANSCDKEFIALADNTHTCMEPDSLRNAGSNSTGQFLFCSVSVGRLRNRPAAHPPEEKSGMEKQNKTKTKKWHKLYNFLYAAWSSSLTVVVNVSWVPVVYSTVRTSETPSVSPVIRECPRLTSDVKKRMFTLSQRTRVITVVSK